MEMCGEVIMQKFMQKLKKEIQVKKVKVILNNMIILLLHNILQGNLNAS